MTKECTKVAAAPVERDVGPRQLQGSITAMIKLIRNSDMIKLINLLQL